MLGTRYSTDSQPVEIEKNDLGLSCNESWQAKMNVSRKYAERGNTAKSRNEHGGTMTCNGNCPIFIATTTTCHHVVADTSLATVSTQNSTARETFRHFVRCPGLTNTRSMLLISSTSRDMVEGTRSWYVSNTWNRFRLCGLISV